VTKFPIFSLTSVLFLVVEIDIDECFRKLKRTGNFGGRSTSDYLGEVTENLLQC